MEDRVQSFNERQLIKAGFGDAVTPELKALMQKGVPMIDHKLEKDYDGDKLEATLYLKKSVLSNYYTLKEFDLQLKKDGSANTVKHTFKITDTNFGSAKINAQHISKADRLTLQEAYNLLAGRSVYKKQISTEGSETHAWIRLNLKQQVQSPEPVHGLYTIKYGIDLEKLLNNYPIKELKSDRERHSLIHSLQRGNLKKVTLVGAKKTEEHLYISMNPAFGSLNIYDKHHQRLSTGELLEKRYIGKDLGLSEKLTTKHVVDNNAYELREPSPKIKTTIGNAITQKDSTKVPRQKIKH